MRRNFMSKYNMRICKCGRIHMIDNDKLDKALENNKDILLMCGHCGIATIIGADIEPDYLEPSKNCYMMYSMDFSVYDDKSITPDCFTENEEHKAIQEIVYSHGIKVPMMTGGYATMYSCGKFADTWYPDFYHIQRADVTVKEIMEFIDKYNKDRHTVNMDRFIAETPDDMLEEISHYLVDGLNWKGTKYENEWDR